jgi:predicted metal-dependent phosphoesterase TrpH
VRVDLHTHSAVSDGTDTPAELVASAVAAGLDVVALTDHDTTAGWQPALAAAPPTLRVLPGAELSTQTDNGISVHLLAYLFDPHAPALVHEQARLRRVRRERLRQMARRMAADGLPVDEHVVFAGLHPDAPAGRPHLARALVTAGAVASVSEAFDRYLHVGGPYYLRRADTPLVAAVRMIAVAGGVTVLAHALAARGGRTVGDEVIAELAAAGLAGVEVDHPQHDVPARTRLRGLAAELGLVVTGGSDYHGANKPTPLAAETTAPEAFEALLERLPERPGVAKPPSGPGAP